MDTLEKEISEIDVRELIMEVRKYAPIWNTGEIFIYIHISNVHINNCVL